MIWQRKWTIGFVTWTLVGLGFAAYAYLDFAFQGTKGGWVDTLSWEMVGWYLWGALSPIVLWLTRRYPLRRQFWIHIFLSIAVSVTHLSLHFVLLTKIVRFLVTPSYDVAANFQEYLFPRFCWRIMVYFILMTAFQAIDSQRKLREEERKASLLETQLANAQLQALKMQLQPHFLFNTLQSISELMHQDICAADEMMVRLADFLRLTLENAGTQEVTLEKELEFLKCYLEIERVRFKDRLHVNMQIEPETKNARFPNLILQPIVENAIRHGIALRSLPGLIEIRAERKNGMLSVQIRDNGPGPAGARETGKLPRQRSWVVQHTRAPEATLRNESPLQSVQL